MSRSDLVALDLSRARWFGRERELRELVDALARVHSRCQDSGGWSECVVIQGDSGTGKSSLLESFHRSKHGSAVFVTCRFQSGYRDVTSSTYATAIADALDSLCSDLIDEEERRHHRCSPTSSSSASPSSSPSGAAHRNSSLKESLKSRDSLSSEFIDEDEEDPWFSPARRALQENLKTTHRTTLCSVIPKTAKKIHKGCNRDNDPDTAIASNRIQHRATESVLRTLVRIISDSLDRPLVIQLEDIHWADVASLRLLQTLATDRFGTNCLFLASYRKTETESASGTSRDPLLVTLGEISNDKGDKFRELEMGALDVNGVNRVIADATEMRPNETLSLAEVVHEKTGGNCYAVNHFLKMLQEEALVNYSFETYSWEWDLAKIRAETVYSDNVVDVVIGRINRLSQPARAILRIASCFGSQFDADLVAVVLRSPNVPTKLIKSSTTLARRRRSSYRSNLVLTKGFHHSMGDFSTDLNALLDADLVEFDSTVGRHKFTHDRIQQAAYSMITQRQEREQLHLRIGTLLFELRKSPERSKEWVFFSAIDQLDRGSSGMDVADKVELAKLNLEAGKIAKSKSAFIPAAQFLQNGLKLLDCLDSKWDSQYELTLDLSDEAAEMEHSSGNAVACQKIAREIIRKAKSQRHKQRAYVALIKSLGDQGRLKESILVGIKANAQLGEYIPIVVPKITMARELKKTSRLVQAATEERSVEPTKPPSFAQLACAELLVSMSFFSVFWKQKRVLPIVCTRLIQLALKYDMTEYIPIAYAAYGLLVAARGNTTLGLRYCEMATKIVNQSLPMSKATVMYIANRLAHWQIPLRQSLDNFLDAYAVGMETGNVEVALLSAGTYCSTYMLCGLPLPPVAEDMRGYMQLIKEYGQDNAYMLLQPVWQTLLNLIDEDTASPIKLTGEAMDEGELLQRATKCQNSTAHRTVLEYRLRLCVLFGNYTIAERVIRKMAPFNGEVKVDFGRAMEMYCSGVTYYALARRKIKHRYIRKARRILHKMEDWVRRGNVNCFELFLVLEAEAKTFARDLSLVEGLKSYDKAIATASRSGFVHLAAHANELAARFCFDRSDEQWGQCYIRQAQSCYRRWGAGSKVKQMETMYDFLEESSPLTRSEILAGSFQGRPRFTRRPARQHSELVLR